VRRFRAARRVKILKVNVMEEIEAPQKQRAKPRSLTEVQAGELLASLKGSWREPVGSSSCRCCARLGTEGLVLFHRLEQHEQPNPDVAYQPQHQGHRSELPPE